MKAQKILLFLRLILIANAGRAQMYRIADLGAGLESDSYAQAINNERQVVGYWYKPDGAHAFLYEAGGLKDLGNLGATNSYALSINDKGQVAGVLETASGAEACIFQNGSLATLGNLGVRKGSVKEIVISA